ncbi:MAG: hypothetical protein NTW10_15135 [Bacteroidetes bacterium]|nr:hypothetical protein [Bacteroidota bacterium]
MKRVFSFAEKQVLFILQLIPSLLPGIEKVIAVHFSPDSGEVTSDIIRKENDEYILEVFKVSDSPSIFNRLRTENAPYSWLRKEDLPFEIKHKEKVQLEIFNELNNSILLIRILNLFDTKNDLFFIYFNQDLSNFGTISPNKILSTDNKTIIGHILRNSILAFLQINRNDKDLFASLNENTRAILRERSYLQGELENTAEKYKEGVIRLSNSYLVELEKSNGIHYRLSDHALKKIKEFSGDIGNLKSIILQAAGFAEAMNLDGAADIVLISDYHIITDESKVVRQKEPLAEPMGDVPVKYNKTFLLLDKLENAAQLVKSKNMLLTGANIGHEFPTPVSPPAITDALKKHKQKILFLFSEYPERWAIIRSEFRPVQNILNTRPFKEQLSA